MDKEIVYRVEDGMDREKILCTTYQMRNFYMQFRDGFFTNLDVMNYIQHLAAAHMAKKGMNVLDVCCGRSLMLPLLRYYAKDIASYTGVDISKANIKEAMRGATAKNLEPKHSHAASDITSGNLPIERGGTGAGTAADACRALGAMRNTGGTFTGTVYFANGTAHYVGSAGDAHFKSLTASEDIHAKRVFEAVYNDYAELMPRGEQTDPGDIIALDTNSQQEKYVKATNLSSRIAGIHSDEYGMLIGGEQVNDGEDFLEKNLPLFIPVSLAGRVHTKVVGPVSTGDCIVLSHIPGVGRAAKPCEYIDPCKVVGYAVEGDDLTEQRRLKVRVRGA